MKHNETKSSEEVKRRKNIILACSIGMVVIAMYSAAIYFGVGKG